MKKLLIAGLALVLWSAPPALADDSRIVGLWKAVGYTIDGVDHPMEGLFIFTARYYSANVRFNYTSKGPIDDANGNAGPYTADGKQVVLGQWVQVHVRPGDKKEPMLSRKGPDETTSYHFEGNRLILTFPSKNKYVLERITE